MTRTTFALIVTSLLVGTLLKPLSALPQRCKECGAATRIAKKKAAGKADDSPKGGHPKLSSGRMRGSLVTFRHGATS